MAVVRVQTYPSEIAKIQYMPVVREALRKQAEAIAARARGSAGNTEVSSSIFVEEGIRPKGRAFARAVSDTGRPVVGGQGKNQRRALLARSADIRT